MRPLSSSGRSVDTYNRPERKMRVSSGHPEKALTESFWFPESIQRATRKPGQMRTGGNGLATNYNLMWLNSHFCSFGNYTRSYFSHQIITTTEGIWPVLIYRRFSQWISGKIHLGMIRKVECYPLTMSQLHPECVDLSIATNLVDSDFIYFRKVRGNLRSGWTVRAKGGSWFEFFSRPKKP